MLTFNSEMGRGTKVAGSVGAVWWEVIVGLGWEPPPAAPMALISEAKGSLTATVGVTERESLSALSDRLFRLMSVGLYLFGLVRIVCIFSVCSTTKPGLL